MRNTIFKIIAIAVLLVSADTAAMSPGSALKKLRKKYSKIETLRADFREVFEWAMTGETTIREGRLIVSKDNRFRIEIPEQLLVSDGKEVYRFNKIKNQVIIEPVGAGTDQLLPNKLLLDFTEGFKAVKNTQMLVSGREGMRLDLMPEDPEKLLISSAAIWLTQDDMIVHRLKLVDLNSNQTTFFLSKIQLNQPIDESETSFTPPEGVELFDLR